MQVGTAQNAGSVFVRTEPFAPSAAQLQEYAGEYRSDEIDAVFRMTVREGRFASSG